MVRVYNYDENHLTLQLAGRRILPLKQQNFRVLIRQSNDLGTLFTLKAHTSVVVRLNFNRDRNRLTSVGEDMTIRAMATQLV